MDRKAEEYDAMMEMYMELREQLSKESDSMPPELVSAMESEFADMESMLGEAGSARCARF